MSQIDPRSVTRLARAKVSEVNATHGSQTRRKFWLKSVETTKATTKRAAQQSVDEHDESKDTKIVEKDALDPEIEKGGRERHKIRPAATTNEMVS